jgi:hypothetical protein
MARYWTWSEIRTKVENDLDLQDESFITATELLAYANEAIDEAEAEIHSIYEDYFLSRATITLVSGTDEYDFPSDVYANKIRGIFYKNGSTVVPVKRLKESRKFEEYTINLTTSAAPGCYNYLLLNQTAGSPQIVLSPPVVESGAYIQVWYLRNANRLTVDADVCDIPEFASFVMQYMKVRCYEKEGHPNLQKAMYDLEAQRVQMTDTLTAMVPDAENQIEPDMSAYDDMT